LDDTAGDGDDPELIEFKSGSNASGADLSVYDEVGRLRSSGGSVALSDGTSITASPGGLAQEVEIGRERTGRRSRGEQRFPLDGSRGQHAGC